MKDKDGTRKATAMRIYLDTSVVSAYFDARTLDRQEATKKLIDAALGSESDQFYISDLVLTELEQTPSPEKRYQMLELVQPFQSLRPDEETLRLARILHQAELVPANKFDDAVHLAIAAVRGVDVVVSWNFRHMVNLKVKIKLPVLLAQERYLRHFEIVSPYEYPEV